MEMKVVAHEDANTHGAGLRSFRISSATSAKTGRLRSTISLEAVRQIENRPEHPLCCRDHEHVAVGQSVPKPFWVVARALAEQVERPLWPKHFVSRFFQSLDHPISFCGKRWHVDAERFEIWDGVLHDCIRKTPSKRHLSGGHVVPNGLPLLPRHARRDSQITKTLTGCEQDLRIAVRHNGPWINLRGADKAAVIKADSAVRLVGEQEDAPPDPLGSAVENLRGATSVSRL